MTNLPSIPRDQHNISRANISPSALKVLRRLQHAGYAAYLVGGGVRDLLLGGHPKDFDIATSATPEEVADLFSNCLLIGRRFRLAHVRFGKEIIEVATFRGNPQGEENNALHEKTVHGQVVRDNVYGTLEEDAWRRDFTVNALYYDLAHFAIVDYTNGMADIQSRTLRIIGDPAQRFREDPVRMLRAIRFMTKLDFSLTEDAAALIPEMADLLKNIPPARLFEEFIKLFMHGNSRRAYSLLQQHGLLYKFFSHLQPLLHDTKEAPFYRRLLEKALENTDLRIAQERPVTPAFLLAVFLWPLYQQLLSELSSQSKGKTSATQRETAAEHALAIQRTHMALPRRFSLMIRDMWELQVRLEKPRLKQVEMLLSSSRFRAAYDFLLLRLETGDKSAHMADWWTTIQTANAAEKEKLLAQLGASTSKKRKRHPSKKKGIST